MARDNLGLRLEITRRTQSQEALQAQHKELTLLYKTSLAQNTRLHQTSDQQQQLHKLQVDENQKLKNQTLSQADQIAAAKERETLSKLDHTRLTETVAILETSNQRLRNTTQKLESQKQMLVDDAAERIRQNSTLREQVAAISAASKQEQVRHKNELEQTIRKADLLRERHTTATQLTDRLRAEIKRDQLNRTAERDAARMQLKLAHTENKQLRNHKQQTTAQLHRAGIIEKNLRTEIKRLEKQLTVTTSDRQTSTTQAAMTITTTAPLGDASSNHQPQPIAGNPKPVYPRLAIKKRLQGDVILTVSIQPTGAVNRVTLKRSSGFKLLDSAAMDAVRHWRYEPLPEDALPVTRSDQIPINFRLKSKT